MPRHTTPRNDRRSKEIHPNYKNTMRNKTCRIFVFLVTTGIFLPLSIFCQELQTEVTPDTPAVTNVTLDVTRPLPASLLFHSLAKTYGKNIIIPPDVKGDAPVANLSALSFEDALTSICQSLKLTWEKKGEVYIVKLPEVPPPAFVPEETRVFTLSHLDSATFASLCQALVKETEGGPKKVEILYSLNSVKVTTSVPILEEIERKREALDKEEVVARNKDLVTEAIYPKYLTLQAVTEIITPLLSDAGSKYSISEKTRVISVTAPRGVIASIRGILAEKDTSSAPQKAKIPPIPQVMIESKFVEFTGDSANYFNIDWKYAKVGGSAFPGYTPGSKIDAATWGNIKIGYTEQAADYLFSMLLDSYISKGKAKLITAPKTSAMDGETASFNYSKTYNWWKATPHFNYEGHLTYTSYDLGTPVEVKISLEITPQIDAENKEVVVTIHPIVEDIIDFISQPDAPMVMVPNTVKEETTTKLRIKDGDTIVIGGLMREKETESTSGPPILSRIPLLGYFFRKTSKTKSTSELLIFLNVRIIP